MKKILLIMVALLAILSFEAKADCPAGYQYASFIYTNSQGCSWTIGFCYKCFGGGPSESTIKNITITPVFTDPMPFQCQYCPAFRVYEQQLINLYSTLCTPPPCGNGQSIQYVIEIPKCCKWVNYVQRNNKGEIIVHNSYETYCSDPSLRKCILIQGYCYNTATQSYQKVGDETFIIDGNSCPIGEPQKPPYPLSWEDSWETACYSYNDNCP